MIAGQPAVMQAPPRVSAAGQRWRDTIALARDLRSSRDPKERAIYARVRDEIVKSLGLQVDASGRLQASIQPSAVHSNQFLTNLSVKYANELYIGAELVPIVRVGKRSDSFATYTERFQLATPDLKTGPEGQVTEVNQERGSDNYSVQDYAAKERISQETLDNQDEVFDEMVDLVEHVTDQILLDHERRSSAFVLDTANYAASQTHSPSTKWDDAGGGTIISDLLTARSAIRRGSGRTRIKMGVPIAVWNVMANNPAIRELFKYTRDGLAGFREFMTYFRIDELHIGEAWEDTANEGQAESLSRIWSTDSVVILSVAETPTRRSAHFASTFQWRDRQQTQWTDPSRGPGSGVIWTKVGVSQQIKGVANKAGYILTDVLT